MKQPEMKQPEYFVDGGTLPPEALSYVRREADRQLLEKTSEGEFCYVLLARQMGKSSLMIRTVHALRKSGISAAIVDLTIIGTSVSIDQWYLGVLSQIRTELRLQQDIRLFWNQRAHIGAAQRFVEFLHDVVLREKSGHVAIFIDEIDTTLTFSFRDDFFGAIRAIYNARASDAVYNRLTFVLLGVAAPTDLMSDVRRTPFNIGERVVLQGFSYDEAEPLRAGLRAYYPRQEDLILQRIFDWTNGHPYMTQRLCRAALEARVRSWDEVRIDALVHQLFLTDEARRDPNLTFVRDRVRVAPAAERREMLTLYRQILNGQVVKDDDRSPPHLYLKLYGLVTADQGRLHVNNQIYKQVFNNKWISEYLGSGQSGQSKSVPNKRQDQLLQYLVIGIVVLVLVIAALALFRYLNG